MARTGPFDERAADYDRWFDEHSGAYLSELAAVRAVLPGYTRAVEIGVGTGRFAQPLGITLGVEPSRAMRRIARARGIEAIDGVAEELAFPDSVFDLVLMVTTICFLDDVDMALDEAHRVLVDGGHIVVAFLDRETKLGREYEARRDNSAFYRTARFRSSAEVMEALHHSGFGDLTSVQTLRDALPDPEGGQSPVEAGYGVGLFVAVRGRKLAVRSAADS